MNVQLKVNCLSWRSRFRCPKNHFKSKQKIIITVYYTNKKKKTDTEAHLDSRRIHFVAESFIQTYSTFIYSNSNHRYTYGQLVSGTLKAVFDFKVRGGGGRWFKRNKPGNRGKKFTIERKVNGHNHPCNM